MKRDFGRSSNLMPLPEVGSEAEWRGLDRARWMAFPPQPRLAPAPIVDCNKDLIFFFSTGHHKHQSGLWSYPSGTLSRMRDGIVSYVEKAEGGVLAPDGFYYSTQWLDQAPAVPGDVVERDDQKPGKKNYRIDTGRLEDAPVVDGEFILCFDGNWRSYYHWLLDSVTRLFMLRRFSSGRILMPAPRDALGPFHLDTLRLLGMSEQQMLWPERGTPFVRYERLVWMNWNPTPWAGLGMLAGMGAAYRAAVGLSHGPGRRKIYCSRQNSRRMVIEGEAIEEMMSRLGFEIVVPDLLSFEEQVRVFGEASWIVGPHGAGLTNILFAPPGCTVVEFMPDRHVRPAYWSMATSLGQRYATMVVGGENFFSNLDVDVARVERFVATLMAVG